MTLTTRTVPISYTCFNVADLFSQSNSTGFQSVTQPIYDNNHQPLEPNGISWTLTNQENYDANANYSSVWYHQQNLTDPEEGARSRWVLFTYAFEDCDQIGADLEPDDYDDWPWFKVSCQTDEDGECHTTPRPIRSFAINKAYVYEDDEDRCMAWAKQGAGGQVRLGYGHLVLAGALALWAVM